MKFVKAILCIIGLAIAAAGQSVWTSSRVSDTGDLVAVYFTSSENGWIAGDRGYLASTNDGGKRWIKYALGTTEDINEIYFRNEQNGYLVAGKKMFITKDAGRSWQETKIYNAGSFRNASPEFLSIRFADKKRGLIIGSLLNKNEEVIDSLVMRTEDGGETWTRIIVPTKKELFHLDFNGSSHAWIVGDEGLILTSTDGGIEWKKQTSLTKMPLYSVDFRDDNIGYAVGKAGTILRTENGGERWDPVPTGISETLMRVDFADDKNGWIVGYGGTILKTSDKGLSWQRQESGTTERLYGLYTSKKYGWAVGAKGLTVKYPK